MHQDYGSFSLKRGCLLILQDHGSLNLKMGHITFFGKLISWVAYYQGVVY